MLSNEKQTNKKARKGVAENDKKKVGQRKDL